MQMFSDRILGTTVSVPLIKKRIRSFYKNQATFGKNFSIERIGENQGFLSITVRLNFDWIGENTQGLPSSIVLKIPSTSAMLRNVKGTTSESIQEQHSRLEMILHVGHVSEVSFYRMCMEKLRENDPLISRLKVPKCIYAQHFRRNGSESGYLLLEDLSASALVCPLYAGLRPLQVKAVLEQVALLHAYSLTNPSWRHGAHRMYRSTFLEVQRYYPEITRERIGRAISQLKRDFGEWFIDLDGSCMLEKLEEVVDEQLIRYNGEAVHESSGMIPVLVHGDLWTNNILWKERNCGDGVTSDQLISVIDWQNVHPGNVAEDFVRLLGSSVSPKIRRTYLHNFVSFYLSKLGHFLREKKVYSMPYTHSQIVDAYERLFAQGLLIMLPSLNACADEGNGLLGEENIKDRQSVVLERTRALIEDFLIYKQHLDEW